MAVRLRWTSISLRSPQVPCLLIHLCCHCLLSVECPLVSAFKKCVYLFIDLFSQQLFIVYIVCPLDWPFLLPEINCPLHLSSQGQSELTTLPSRPYLQTLPGAYLPLAQGVRVPYFGVVGIREKGHEGERQGHSLLTIPDSWAFSPPSALGRRSVGLRSNYRKPNQGI